MGLKINSYMLVKLFKFYKPALLCPRFITRSSNYFVYQVNANHSKNLLIIESQNPIRILKRNFALKLYSQFIPTTAKFSDDLIGYIKNQNDIPSGVETSTLTNVFDSESAIKQIQSVVLHSLETHPEDVIKLFTLYKSYDRSKILQTYKHKESSKLMVFRIQSTVLCMTYNQLHRFAGALNGVRHYNIEFFTELTNFTFEELVSRAELCESFSDVLNYFMIGVELFGNSIGNKKVFLEFMSLFEKHIQNATPHQLCQVLYFLGLSSKQNQISSEFPMITVKLLVPRLEEVTLIDVGLAVNGLYRLKLLLEEDLTYQISKKVIKDMDNINDNYFINNLNSFAFVSVLKYLRLAQFQDKSILEVLKNYIRHLDENSSNPQLISHLVAYYANNNYYDHDIYSILGDHFFQSLKSPTDVVRIKDISRFMWSISHVQHQRKIEDLNLVIESLGNFTKTSGELLKHASHVVDSLLALAILNVHSEELMKIVLQPSVLKNMKDKGKTRFISRLLVLKEVQKTAFPSLDLRLPSITSEDVPNRKIAMEILHRPSFKRISDALALVTNECNTQIFTLSYLVPHINICSIVLTGNTPSGQSAVSDVSKRVLKTLSSLNNFKIAIDVDDCNTTVNEGTRPNGLEVLKRRLLRSQGWDIKVLSTDEIESCGDDDGEVADLLLKTIET